MYKLKFESCYNKYIVELELQLSTVFSIYIHILMCDVIYSNLYIILFYIYIHICICV